MEVDRETLFKLQMFEQQINQLQKQSQAVENGVVELQSLAFGLEELKGKKGEEIMAPIGNGIFTRAKLLSEELIVDVGNKNLIKKSIPETKKLIQSQIAKLEDVKKELNDNIENLGSEMMKIIEKVQGRKKD